MPPNKHSFSGIPRDILASVAEDLNILYPEPRLEKTEDLSTESGRIMMARKWGRREVVAKFEAMIKRPEVDDA